MRWAVLVLVVLSVGCGEPGRRVVASVDDYGGYKRFRAARTIEDRLGYSYDYLRRNPQGRWRPEVRRWLSVVSRRYVQAAWDDVRRLRFYLEAAPVGPLAKRVASRIVELEIAQEFEQRKAEEFDAKVERFEQQLARAARGRAALRAEFATRVRALAAFRGWGEGVEALQPTFAELLGAVGPQVRCAATGCIRSTSVGYAVAEGKMQSPREAVYDVVLALQGGRARAVTLTGPELFSRVGEAVTKRPVAPRNYRARTEALAIAVQMVAVAVEATMPEAECRVAPVSPTLLERRCFGTRLTLVAGVEPGEEDRVVVEADPTVQPVADE